MTISVEGLGPLLDLATAIGLIDDQNQFNDDWFTDPGRYVSGMLRTPYQRDALLNAVDQMLAQGTGVLIDGKGRHWTPIIREGGFVLYLVVSEGSSATELGIGAAVQTADPAEASLAAYVPLFQIPAGSSVTVPFLDGSGKVSLDAVVTLNGGAPAPGEAGLQGFQFSAEVATDGSSPILGISLRGLQLPGQSAPSDISLSGDLSTLGDEALHLVLGLIQQAASTATGELAELLALVGVSGDTRIPSLPLSTLITDGLPAWKTWLEAVFADATAVDAWLDHLSQLVGHGAQVHAAIADGLPHRVSWMLASGLELSALVTVTRTAPGVLSVELGLEGSLGTSGTPQGALELETTLTRITLGSPPAVVGLPYLALIGRIGNSAIQSPADLLVNEPDPTPKVGSLRLGMMMGENRQAGLVLAAHDVTILGRPYPVLDLTNPQTLADVGTNALSDLGADILARLGPAAVTLRVLMGIDAPAGPAVWPTPLTSLSDLLANPPGAILAYHQRVLNTDRAHYAVVLDSLRTLLVSAGLTTPISGTGDAAKPWRLEIAADVALVVWLDGSRVEIGVTVDHHVVDLGGGCPDVTLTLLTRLASLGLDGSASQVLPGVLTQVMFAARGGVPLRIGDTGAAIRVDRVGVDFAWTQANGLQATLLTPGLAAEIDGEQVPFAIPSLAADGTLAGEVPWRALELLSGHLLTRLGLDWSAELVRLLGWLPGQSAVSSRLLMESIFTDPANAIAVWVAGAVREALLPEIARALSLVVNGSSAPGLPAGMYRGRGDAASPLAIPLGGASSVEAPLRMELLLWSDQPPLALYGGAVLQPNLGQIIAALQQAGMDSADVADLLADRGDLSSGLVALAARWTETDGLVRLEDALLPGALALDLEGVVHSDLPQVDLSGLTGVTLDAGTVIAVTPIEPQAWPGIAEDHILDLSMPSLAPEAFDLSRVATEDGPWLVRLPGRLDAVVSPGDDGATLQAARLNRVVDAVSSRVAGTGPVAVIGYGAAGHAAVQSAVRPGVTHLVTLGTPHGGLSLDVLEVQPAAGALQLLAALLPVLNEDVFETAALRLARGLVAPLQTAYQAATSPLVDLIPPSLAPVIPASVQAYCIRGRISARQVLEAFAALISSGLPALAGVSSLAGGETVHWGLNITLDPPAAAGQIHVSLELALTGQFFAGTSQPGLRARLGIGRAGGWLSGGPDPTRPDVVSRHPSLRRAVIEVYLPAGSSASAHIIFHEASALGVSHRRWEVGSDATSNPLLPEAQLLVGRLAAALGPLPASGPVRQIVDLLSALGLTDPATGATGGPVGFSQEAVRRLLADPAGLLSGLGTQAKANLVAALAALFGATAPSSGSTSLQFQLDGFTISADLAAWTVQAETTNLALAAGIDLSASVELTSASVLVGQLGLALGSADGPNGRPVLTVTTAPLSGEICWEDGGSLLPQPVTLFPVFDEAGLSHLLVDLVPAQLLWAGITFLRTLQPGAVDLVDPLLRLLGLLNGEGAEARVALPLALIKNPAYWLTHPQVLGDGSNGPNFDRISDLLDVAAAMFGIAQPQLGAWTLPYGLILSTGRSNGRDTITLSQNQPLADTGLRLAGSIGLAMGGGLPISPLVDTTLALPSTAPITDSGRITLSVSSSGLAARLILPASGIDLALLPDGPGLASLGSAAAAAAVTYALPLVLDGVAGLPSTNAIHPISVALGDLGDALGLRQNGHFDGAQIISLANDPGPQLGQRLYANRQAALDAFVDLLHPVLPSVPGYTLSRVGDELVFTYTGQTAPALALELRLSVPGGATPQGVRLAGSVNNVRPFTGAALGSTLIIDPTGLTEASIAFAIDYANAVDLGPISLVPVAEVAIGSNPTGGARVAAGLAVDGTHTLRGVFHLGETPSFALEPSSGITLEEALIKLLLPPLVDLALSITEVQELLDKAVLGGPSIRELLDNVVFTGIAFDPGVLDTTTLWDRLLILAANIARHTPALPIDPLVIKIAKRDQTPNDQVYGLSVSLPPGERFTLVDSDITIDVEIDSSWVNSPATADGLLIELLRVNNGAPELFFGISVRGLGLRIGNASGPLLDTELVLDTVALHGLFSVNGSGSITEVGGQIELGNLHLALGGEDSGSNPVASGVLRDAASGGEQPKLAFSPALAVQSLNGGAPSFDLRAGEGNGPWWIGIQRGFGPVYIEQIGFGVGRDGQRVISVSILIDGKVSLLGLVVMVEGLSLGVKWPQDPTDPPLYSPEAWMIDLSGLGVSASTCGVIIAGGLSRSPGALPDYVGMISVRFSVYGISAYGGYAVVIDSNGQYTSLFIYGALNAPLGGPPAFFVTGIGAGVGVNRLMLLPNDLNLFPTYPLLQALDRNSPMADPETALDSLRAYFPVDRGTFWFAAGLSFNSFSLIDGIAVIGVMIGDGLDINLLGLARAGLPNPSAPLIQIELALIARFSSEEGVLWVQAQLTDNSFLLTRDCRLTGGFAFVLWLAGDKAGEFVVTLGGYHPSFHRDGYPVVPRLGFVWNVSDALVIKGESYFALTSEAIMAGTRFEASLTLGPLWAYLRLGADGIIYFDPFHFLVTAFAELGAGVTIDVDLGWFGHIRVTISINLHADVTLEGPEFHGSATIDLDVTSATIAFGSTADRSTPVLGWTNFESKYLKPNDAAMLTVIPGQGTVPPSSANSKKAPTGQAGDPFLVLPEFVLTITSTGAISIINANGPVTGVPQAFLAIGPMQVAAVDSTLTVSVKTPDGTEYVRLLNPIATIGRFPKGVWGPQPQDEPKPIPMGEVIEAANGVTLTADANISAGTVEIDYYQVETGPRLPLPFLEERKTRSERAEDVLAAQEMVENTPADPSVVMGEARARLVHGPQSGGLSPLAAIAYSYARSAPPQLAPLTYGMAIDPGDPVEVPPAPPKPEHKLVDTNSYPLQVDALLSTAPRQAPKAKSITTVGDAGKGLPRVTPPLLADVQAGLDPRLPVRLIKTPPSAKMLQTGLIAAASVPFTGRAGAGAELRRRVGKTSTDARRLDSLTRGLQGDGIDLVSGDVAVLTARNSNQDVETSRPSLLVEGDLPLRLLALDPAGAVILDSTTAGTISLPRRTERIVALGGADLAGGMPGWHAGTQLAQVSAHVLVGPGCVVTTGMRLGTRRGPARVSAGFVSAAEAARGYSLVTTRLPAGLSAIALVLENAPRMEDQRGDALDLGLTGANRVNGLDGAQLPPTIIVDGSRTIQIYKIQPDEEAQAIEVTVASGEHVYLSGIVGCASGLQTLADALRSDLVGSLACLVTAGEGVARVRWLPADPNPPRTIPPGKEGPRPDVTRPRDKRS